MSSRIFILFVFTFLYSSIYSQVTIDKESMTLYNCINGFLTKADKYSENRKSEAILMLLEVDSNGSISKIHLLADNNNIDSSYSILTRMKPENFTPEQFGKWKNKIINLPVYSLTGINHDSTGKRILTYVENSIIHHSTPFESRRSVMPRPVYYLTPGIQVIRHTSATFLP